MIHPLADLSPETFLASLKEWEMAADLLRDAAMRAKAGERPSSLTIAAANEALNSVMLILETMDQAFDKLQAGKPEFSALLNVQMKAVGLLESLGNSQDLLTSLVAVDVTEPHVIAKPLRVAAE